jgi:hypothetical protein
MAVGVWQVRISRSDKDTYKGAIMRTANLFYGANLGNISFGRLSYPMQFWMRQQVQQIVRSRRFGLWEEMRLNEVIRQKASQFLPTGSAEFSSLTSILGFIALSETIRSYEEQLNTIGDDAQLANIDLQNMLQKQQQTVQMLSHISKTALDTAMAVIRKMGG